MASFASAPPKLLGVKAVPGSEDYARKYDVSKLIPDLMYLNKIQRRDRILDKVPSSDHKKMKLITEYITEDNKTVKIQYKHTKAKYIAPIYARVLPPPPPSNINFSLKTMILLEKVSKLNREKLQKQIESLDSDFYTRLVKLKKQQRQAVLFETWVSNMVLLAGGSVLLYGSVTLFGPAAISFLLKKGLLHSKLTKTLFKASLEACFNLRPDQLASLDPILQTLDTAMLLAQAESVPPLDPMELFSLAFNGKNPFVDSISDEDLKKNLMGSDGKVNGGLKEYQDSVINFNNALYDLILPDFLAPFFHIKPVATPGSTPAPKAKPDVPGQPRDLRSQLEDAFAITDTEVAIERMREILTTLNGYVQLPIGLPQIDLLLATLKTIHKAQVVTGRLFSTAEFTVSFYKQYKFQIDNVIGYITGKETRSQEFKKTYLDSIANKLRSNLTLRNEFSSFSTKMILGTDTAKYLFGEPTEQPYTVTDPLLKQIKDIPLFGNVILFYESITPANCLGYVSGVVYDEMTGMITSKVQSFYPASIAAPPPLPGDDDDKRDEEKRKIQAYKNEMAEIQKSLIQKGLTGNKLVDTIRQLEKVKHPDYVYKKEDIELLDYVWIKTGDTYKVIKNQGLFGTAATWTSLASIAYLYGYTMNYTENVSTEMKGSFRDVFSFWTQPFVNVIKSILTTNATAAMARIVTSFFDEIDKIYNSVYEEYVRRPMRESGIYKRWEELIRSGKQWLANKLENRFYLSAYIHGALESVLDLFFKISVSIFTEAPNRWVRQYTYDLKARFGLTYINNVTMENLILNTIPNNVAFLYDSLKEHIPLPDNIFDAFNLDTGVAAMRNVARIHRGEYEGIQRTSRLATNFAEAGQPSLSAGIDTSAPERPKREPRSGILGPLFDSLSDITETVEDATVTTGKAFVKEALSFVEAKVYQATGPYHDIRYVNANTVINLPGGQVYTVADEGQAFDYTKLSFAETYAEYLFSQGITDFEYTPDRVNRVIDQFNNLSDTERTYILSNPEFQEMVRDYFTSIKPFYQREPPLTSEERYDLLGRMYREKQDDITRGIVDKYFGVKPLPFKYVSINGKVYKVESIPSDDPENPNKDMRPREIQEGELVGSDTYLYSHIFGVTITPVEDSEIPSNERLQLFSSMDSFNRGFLQVTYGRGIIKGLTGSSLEETLNPIGFLNEGEYLQVRNYNFVGGYFYSSNIPVSEYYAQQQARSRIMEMIFSDNNGTVTRGDGSAFDRLVQRHIKYNKPLQTEALTTISEGQKMARAMASFQQKVNDEPDPEKKAALQSQWSAYLAADPEQIIAQGKASGTPDVSALRVDPLIFSEAYTYKQAAKAKQRAQNKLYSLLPADLRKTLEGKRGENLAALEEKINRRRQVIDVLVGALPPDDDDPNKVNPADIAGLMGTISELKTLDPSSQSETIEVEEEILGVKVKKRRNIYSFFETYLESLKNGRAKKTDVAQLKFNLNTLSSKYGQLISAIQSFKTRNLNEDPTLIQSYYSELNTQFVDLFNNQRTILTKNKQNDDLVELFPGYKRTFEDFYLRRRYTSLDTRNNDVNVQGHTALQQKLNSLNLIDPVLLGNPDIRDQVLYFTGKLTLLTADLGKYPVETVEVVRETPGKPEGERVTFAKNYVGFQNGEIDFATARAEIDEGERRLTALDGRISDFEGEIDIFLGSLADRGSVEHRIFDVSKRILGLIPDDKTASSRPYIASQAMGNYYIATKEQFYLHPNILASMTPGQREEYERFRTQQSTIQTRAGERNTIGIQIQGLFETITRKLAELPKGTIITQEIIDLNSSLTSLINRYDFNIRSEITTLTTSWDIFRRQMADVYRSKRQQDLSTSYENLPEMPVSIGRILQLRNDLDIFSDSLQRVPLMNPQSMISPPLNIQSLINDLDLTIGSFMALLAGYDGAGQFLTTEETRNLLTYETPDLSMLYQQFSDRITTLLQTHAVDSTGAVQDFSFIESQLDRLVTLFENQFDAYLVSQRSRKDIFDSRVRGDITGAWVDNKIDDYKRYFGNSNPAANAIFQQIDEYVEGISASASFNSQMSDLFDVVENPVPPQSLSDRISGTVGKYLTLRGTINDLESLSPQQIKLNLQANTGQITSFMYDLELLKNKNDITDLFGLLEGLYDRDIEVLLDIPVGSLPNDEFTRENNQLKADIESDKAEYLRIQSNPSESARQGLLLSLGTKIRNRLSQYEPTYIKHKRGGADLKYREGQQLVEGLISRRAEFERRLNTGLEDIPEGVDPNGVVDYKTDVIDTAFRRLIDLQSHYISKYVLTTVADDSGRTRTSDLDDFDASYLAFRSQVIIVSRYLNTGAENVNNLNEEVEGIESTETLSSLFDAESGITLNLGDMSTSVPTFRGSYDASSIGNTDITNDDVQQLSEADSNRAMEYSSGGEINLESIPEPVVREFPEAPPVTTAVLETATAHIDSGGTLHIVYEPSPEVEVPSPPQAGPPEPVPEREAAVEPEGADNKRVKDAILSTARFQSRVLQRTKVQLDPTKARLTTERAAIQTRLATATTERDTLVRERQTLKDKPIQPKKGIFWDETMASAEQRRARELKDYDRQIAAKNTEVTGIQGELDAVITELGLLDSQFSRSDDLISRFQSIINRITTEYNGFSTEEQRTTFLEDLRVLTNTADRESNVLRRGFKNYMSNESEANFHRSEAKKIKPRIQAILDAETGQATVLIRGLRESIDRAKQRERELGSPAEGSPEASELAALRVKIASAEDKLRLVEQSLLNIQRYEQNIDHLLLQLEAGNISNEQIKFLFDTANDFMESIETELRSIFTYTVEGKKDISVGLKETPDSDQSLIDNLNDRLLGAQINLNYINSEMTALTNMQSLSIKLTEGQKERLRNLQALATTLTTRITAMQGLSNALKNKQGLSQEERVSITTELDQEIPIDEKQQINFYVEVLNYNQGLIGNFMSYLSKGKTREKPLDLDFLKSGSSQLITQEDFQKRFLAEFLLFEYGFITSTTKEADKVKMRDCLLNGKKCDSFPTGTLPDEITIPKLKEIMAYKDTPKDDKDYSSNMRIYAETVGKYEFATNFFGGFVFQGVEKEDTSSFFPSRKYLPIGFTGEFRGQTNNIADRLNFVTTNTDIKGDRLSWVHTTLTSISSGLETVTAYIFFEVAAPALIEAAKVLATAAMANPVAAAAFVAVLLVSAVIYLSWDELSYIDFEDLIGPTGVALWIAGGEVLSMVYAAGKTLLMGGATAIAAGAWGIAKLALMGSVAYEESVVDKGKRREANKFVEDHKSDRWSAWGNILSIASAQGINLNDPMNQQIRDQYMANLEDWSRLFMNLKESDIPNRKLWTKISAAQQKPSLDPNWFEGFDGDEIRQILGAIFPGGSLTGGVITEQEAQQLYGFTPEQINTTLKHIVGEMMKKNLPLVGDGISIQTYQALVLNDIRCFFLQVFAFVFSAYLIKADGKNLKDLKIAFPSVNFTAFTKQSANLP